MSNLEIFVIRVKSNMPNCRMIYLPAYLRGGSTYGSFFWKPWTGAKTRSMYADGP